ncbi:unnamed protein product [Periconia digitata]|uniref:Uncharacterized protein n=1 Tax=Periconia digitata TaxID=1303443 RepID=A0A9W4UWG0_9PLEO|nr:unnamed protein product [Periconia digitata]
MESRSRRLKTTSSVPSRSIAQGPPLHATCPSTPACMHHHHHVHFAFASRLTTTLCALAHRQSRLSHSSSTMLSLCLLHAPCSAEAPSISGLELLCSLLEPLFLLHHQQCMPISSSRSSASNSGHLDRSNIDASDISLGATTQQSITSSFSRSHHPNRPQVLSASLVAAF